MSVSEAVFDPVFLGLGTVVVAAAVSGGANWLVLAEWRHTIGRHWTERARALYRARKAAALNSGLIFLGTVLAGCAVSDFFSDSFPWWVLIGAILGVAAGYYPLQRAIFPGRTVKAWIAAVAINLSLQVISLGLFFACVLGMPRDFGLTTWLIAGGWIALQFAFEFGLWLRFLRFARLLLPPSARLTRIVTEAASRSGISVRAVWEINSPASQAAVFITTRTLVFTRPLLERLADAEVESVCLHELAHLTEPKSIVRLRVLGQFSRVPLLFATPVAVQFGSTAYALIALSVGLPFALFRVRRRMEQRADRMAVSATADPAVYARALEKIYETNQMPAVLGGRGIHPDLYDRMVTAGVVPDYPRPAKPKGFHWTSGALLILVVATFFTLMVYN